MVMDDQKANEPVHFSTLSRGPIRARVYVGLSLVLALAATGVVLGGALYMAAPGETPSGDRAASPTPFNSPRLKFDGPKPEIALLISGQMHGYIQPCGCAEIQKGGLARRYNLIQQLRARGWTVVSADLGDLAQRPGGNPHLPAIVNFGPEAALKYKYSLDALRLMDYTAVGFGQNEMILGLFEAVAGYAANESKPRIICSNLLEREKNFAGMIASGVVSSNEGLKIGFVALVDPSVKEGQAIDPNIKFDPQVKEAVDTAMKEWKTKPDLTVLLLQAPRYEGHGDDLGKKMQTPREKAMDIAKSKKIPHFDVIATLADRDEPSSIADVVDDTLILSVGEKGKNVWVVGFYPPAASGKPFRKNYELIHLEPTYDTPKGKEKENPIHDLLQDYADRVKRDNYLAKFSERPQLHVTQIREPGSEFVGSQKCKSCHPAAYKKWSESKHSLAFKSLVDDAKRPNQRQFDGECVVCHVVGLGYVSGFKNEKDTPHLLNVGCEASSCHGPASKHVKNPNDEKLYPLINPIKYNPNVKANEKDTPQDKARKLVLRNNLRTDYCIKCHDQDNSPKFDVDKYWKEIEHPTPEP